MKRALTAAVTVVAAWTLTTGVAAATPSDAQQAFSVVRTVIRDLAVGQAADAWTHLVPAQQTLVPEEAYVRCRAGRTLAIRRVTFVRSKKEQFTIPGTQTNTAALAVDVNVTPAQGSSQTIRAHMVKVGSAWRYTLVAGEVAPCSPTAQPSG